MLVAIRPDHGPGVGAGHLGRCLALAEAFLAEGCEVGLVATGAPADWVGRYEAAGATVLEATAVGRADVVVFDGYRIPAAEHRAAPAGATVLVIDDHGITSVGRADVVVDQNAGAAVAPGWPDGALALLGSPFALVRSEVRAARVEPWAAPGPGAPVLVAAGGSPPAPWLDLLRAGIGASGWAGAVEELRGVADIGPALAGAVVGVVAAGSTIHDALCVGLPCVVVAFVDNQRPVARRLGAAGLVVDAGDGGEAGDLSARSLAERLGPLLADPALRRSMAERGREVVDGLGAARVARATLVLHGGGGHADALDAARSLPGP